MSIKYTNILIITLIYISGIIIQNFLSLPVIIPIIGFSLLLLYIILKKKYTLFFVLIIFIGIINTYIAQNNYFYKTAASYFDKIHIIEGQINSHPIKTRKSYKFNFKIKKINNESIRSSTIVFLKPKVNIKKNDILILNSTIKKPSGPDNFGEIDYGLYYKKQKIDGTIFINHKHQIKKIIPCNNRSLTYLAWIIREDIKQYIKKHYYPIQNSFLNGLLLGERVQIPLVIKNIFINSGTIHLLAISGLHIGLIALIFFTLFKSLSIPKKSSTILTLLILILYNFIIGYKPPIIRATIMFGTILLCTTFDRDKNYLNNLALAGLMILLIDPLSIEKVSFQMSFLAAAGIIIFTPVFNKTISKYIPSKNKIIVSIKTIITASISAQILIMPILFINFGQFAYISIIANIIAIPLTTVIVSISLFSYLFYHTIPIITMLFSKISNALIAFLIYILNFLSKIPVIKFNGFEHRLLIIYCFILFIFFYKLFIKKPIKIFENKKIKYCILFLLTIISIVIISFNYNTLTLNKKNNVEIVFFNIRGRSILVKTPSNKIILIDSGYESDFKKHILPFLKRNNIHTIDYLLSSNILSARSQAIPYILNKHTVQNYMDSGYISNKYRYERILEIISKKGIKYKIIQRNNRFTIDKIRFEILNPPSQYFKSFKKDNSDIKNNSIVLKISYKNKKILLCSDLGKRGIKYLFNNNIHKIKSDVIAIPNINNTDIYKNLFKFSMAEYIIVNKRYSHFEKENYSVLKRLLNKINKKHYFTQNNGSIKLIIDNKITVLTSR